jgi:tetrahydromethanopterin S-methyltransferase subunit G
MKTIRQAAKPVSLFLTIFMLLMSVPYQPALAAMIGTETMIDITRGQESREYIKTMLVRKDVQAALIAHGIDPMEAKARVDSLSNAEVVRLADRIEQLPAGGDIGILSALIIILLLVLILRLT